jgi:imidazolonepropionase
MMEWPGEEPMLSADFAVFNVDQLVTLAPNAHPAASGPLGIVERGALAARNGKIVWLGPMDDFHDNVRLDADATAVNPHGRVVLPGFVDPHTHPVFAGTRVDDFYRRALGERYPQQLQSGGIMETVRATRAASEDALLDAAFSRADGFLCNGTTTIEAKTGYGLTREDEAKSLRVLTRLQRLTRLKIVPAFLGAHVVPGDFEGDPDAYVSALIQEWLPVARGMASIVDVWADDGAFSEEQSRRILQAAKDFGFGLTAHANELGPHRGVRVATELGALSVDHAVYLDDDDIAALVGSGTVAVLLPATTLFLGSDTYAPARRLLDAGVRVALGTDFNPGTSFTQNMQLVLSLAVMKLGMTAEEVLCAATINAAAAVGMEDRVGSLEVGKFCDLSIFTVDDYRSIPYHLGANLVDTVVAGGEVVVRDGKSVLLMAARA